MAAEKYPFLDHTDLVLQLIFQALGVIQSVILLLINDAYKLSAQVVLKTPMKFSVETRPIRNTPRVSLHLKVEFHNDQTLIWNIYSNVEPVNGNKAIDEIEGLQIPTYFNDSEQKESLNSFVVDQYEAFNKIHKNICNLFKTELTDVIFADNTARDVIHLFDENVLLEVASLHIEKAPERFFTTNLFQTRKLRQKPTTFAQARWIDSDGISPEDIEYVHAEMLKIGFIGQCYEDALPEIRKRTLDNRLNMFSFSFNFCHVRVFNLWETFNVVGLTEEFLEEFQPMVSIWDAPIISAGVSVGKFPVEERENEHWVFYVTVYPTNNMTKVEMIRWGKKPNVADVVEEEEEEMEEEEQLEQDGQNEQEQQEEDIQLVRV